MTKYSDLYEKRDKLKLQKEDVSNKLHSATSFEEIVKLRLEYTNVCLKLDVINRRIKGEWIRPKVVIYDYLH